MTTATQSTPELLILSPFPEELLPVAWEWWQEFAAQMLDDSAPKSFEEMRALHAQWRERGGVSYCVGDTAGKPVGMVWFDAMGDGVMLGHLAFARHGLGRRGKLAAVRQCLRRLFAEGARKVCWSAFADNRAFLWFLRAAGASTEGTLRLNARRGGELVDVVLLASFPEEEG